MRGGLSAIQQTLTPEAATVLSHSIAEAGRRNHGQTTPLHVAATLLAAPSGFLRQACIRSHPNSSHPLQCRALELCFSVALERLPTTVTGGAPAEPPISNALMAALKRAQAHQRRGCPEQQQQPLLAVKVELEQLIISILDDPSVSRVMREASFSSPAVKAAIEQVLNSQPNSGSGPKIGLCFRPPGLGAGVRNLYLNPRLQQQGSNGLQPGPSRGEDVKRVVEILSRHRKRNPVLVGESEPREVVKEVLKIRDGILKNVEVVSVEKELGSDRSQMPAKLKELGGLIERQMVLNSNGGSGAVLDLGDLKWLVDQPANQGVSEVAREVVSEMGKILRKFGEGSKFWLIGTATCETYLRCQVYHTTMESEWDLQVVSIVARSSVPGMMPRMGTNGGILSSSVECLSPMKSFPMPASPLTRRVAENLDPLRRFSCCPHCSEKYNQELAILVAAHAQKSASEGKTVATGQSLPLWLQNAKLNTNDSIKGASDLVQNKDQDLILRHKTQELQKKWTQTCLQLHPNFHQSVSSERITPSPLSMTGLYSPNILSRQPFQPKLQPSKSPGDALQLSISSSVDRQCYSDQPTSPPSSPVETDLVLGRTKPTETAQDKCSKDCLKDFSSISSESQHKVCKSQGIGKPGTPGDDIDSFKKLLKGLTEKVWWQTDAASALASAITQHKLGNGKPRVGSKGDVWLMFSGPDRIGKKKMAASVSELVRGTDPVLISLGSRRDGDESDSTLRGKTVIDRIAEAVRRNPFSVIILQDIDEADILVQGSIKRAMERGRLTDSHGREISLGNVIFILTSNWIPDQLKRLSSGGGLILSQEKLISLASGGWQLRISIGERPTGKRPTSWLQDDDGARASKQRKEMGPACPFDLNQMADIEDDRHDGSHSSSNLTVDHEEEHVHESRGSPTNSAAAAPELLASVDEAIIFKPVDFARIRQNIERTILGKFSAIVGDKISLKLESEAMERILSGIWLGQTTLDAWIEKVLVPCIHQINTTSTLCSWQPHQGKMVAQLELDKGSDTRAHGDWLPSRISVVADAQ